MQPVDLEELLTHEPEVVVLCRGRDIGDGHLVRLWRASTEHGSSAVLGLYRAGSKAEPRRTSGCSTAVELMRISISPLDQHPNDPARTRVLPKSRGCKVLDYVTDSPISGAYGEPAAGPRKNSARMATVDLWSRRLRETLKHPCALGG
jgi:muconolactone delta-isomerase